MAKVSHRRVVAVFFDPVNGIPCWVVDPTGNYKKRGHGEFYQFKGEFPYSPTDMDGLPSCEEEEAIASAQALHWELMLRQK